MKEIKFDFVPDLYLQFILQELGENISVIKSNGTFYNRITTIHGQTELVNWCEKNLYSNNEFEFSPLNHKNQI